MSIKSVTFSARKNFTANLYALEVSSRFLDSSYANAYYAGYGDELAATVVGSTIQIGTGALIVQGRMVEITAAETTAPSTITDGEYGYVCMRIETYHPSDTSNCSLVCYTGSTLAAAKAKLTQNDTYTSASNTSNVVYECPLWSFYVSGSTFTSLTRVIDPVDSAAAAAEEAQAAAEAAQAAVAGIPSPSSSDNGKFLGVSGGAYALLDVDIISGSTEYITESEFEELLKNNGADILGLADVAVSGSYADLTDIEDLEADLDSKYVLSADLGNEIEALDTYATKSDLASIDLSADLTDYLKTADLSTEIAALNTYATTASLSNYATTSSLSNYALIDNLPSYITISGSTLYVNDSAIGTIAGEVDLTDYATIALVESYQSAAETTTDTDGNVFLNITSGLTAGGYVTTDNLSTEIAALDTYATKSDLSNVSVDLTGYATESYVTSAIEEAALEGVDLSETALLFDTPIGNDTEATESSGELEELAQGVYLSSDGKFEAKGAELTDSAISGSSIQNSAISAADGTNSTTLSSTGVFGTTSIKSNYTGEEEDYTASGIGFEEDYNNTLYGTWYYNGSDIADLSDKNAKNTISDLSDSYEKLFDNLRPVSYKYNNGTSDRLHTGFIAQEVEEAILAAGLTTVDFGAFVRKSDGLCALRYSEFIALCVDKIQKLEKRIEELEEKLSEEN